MKEDPVLLYIIASFLSVWLLGLTVVIVRMVKRYRKLTQGIKKKELREILESAHSKLNQQENEIQKLSSLIDELFEKEEYHLQKVGFVRFNPFADTGGDQSFCLALLDRHDNGIVISSLHSRDQTRIYSKKVEKGKSLGQELSKEEKKAIEKAQPKT